ncbi:MAG: hypothetical protein DRP08_03855, partial [Candidatus Aenigmatarchaeota archaeon]
MHDIKLIHKVDIFIDSSSEKYLYIKRRYNILPNVEVKPHPGHDKYLSKSLEIYLNFGADGLKILLMHAALDFLEDDLIYESRFNNSASISPKTIIEKVDNLKTLIFNFYAETISSLFNRNKEKFESDVYEAYNQVTK